MDMCRLGSMDPCLESRTPSISRRSFVMLLPVRDGAKGSVSPFRQPKATI